MKNYVVAVSFLVSLSSVSVLAADETYQTSKTAENQAHTERDTDLTRTIRQKLMADESLSMNAHNIKIISEQGHIVLRGPVKSSAEKAKVEKIAKSVAGKMAVTNETVVSE